MNSESMGTLPCHANIIQRKVKIFSKAAARPLRFSEARIITFSCTLELYLNLGSMWGGGGGGGGLRDCKRCAKI